MKPITIDEIFQIKDIKERIQMLKSRPFNVPEWSELEKEYDPKKHPVMDAQAYKDRKTKTGEPEKVSRITLPLQPLLVNRITQLMVGIPVKRVYNIDLSNPDDVTFVETLERIMDMLRIDSLNLERAEAYFKACEVLTIWYAVPDDSDTYNIGAKLKLKHRTFNPAEGDKLYVVRDMQDDVTALCVEFTREFQEGKEITYFEVWSATTRQVYARDSGTEEKAAVDWEEIVNEPNVLKKIPGIYIHRNAPIWASSSENIFEAEWILSRMANYNRANTRPTLVVKANKVISYGQEKSQDETFRSMVQVPEGASVDYATWNLSIDSNKFVYDTIIQNVFTIAQMPNLSYENIKNVPSGDAQEQLMIDAHLKVNQEKGRFEEFLDREMNVIKKFLETMWPDKRDKLRKLSVKHEIVPYKVNNAKTMAETLSMLVQAGILSKLSASKIVNLAANPEKDQEQIRKEREQEEAPTF